MKRVRSVMRACLAAPVVLGLHCGSGGAENPGASSDANYETIRAAEGFLDSNQAATPQEIATFLSGRPDVEIAEAGARSLWGDHAHRRRNPCLR